MLTKQQMNIVRQQVQFDKNVQLLGEYIFFDFLDFVDNLVHNKR